MGFALFAVLMAFMLFGSGVMQKAWGLSGLLASEAVFLILAIAYAVILRIPLKEMFPAGKIRAADFFGSLFLTTGGLLFGMISIALTGLFYPKSLEGSDVSALNSYIGGGSGYLFTILALALAPAVCEEAIHRGAILANFRAFKKDWTAVLIMGLFFGIFHLSSLRFINTAVMGACLTYIVVKKNNILLSSLMHFLINFVSVSLSFLLNNLQGAADNGDAAVQMTSVTMKSVLGTYLIAGIAAPFLIVTGLMLLDRQSHKKIRFLFAGIISVIMLICSIAITVSDNSGKNAIVHTNLSYTVEAGDTVSPPVGFDIENEGDYLVTAVITNASGEYSVSIRTDDGETVTAGTVSQEPVRSYTQQLYLKPGGYKLYVGNGTGTVREKPVITVRMDKV